MKIADAPTKFEIPFADDAGVGYINTIPVEPSGVLGRASLLEGFPPANFVPVAAGGTPPFGQDMNGILNQITQWSRWQATGSSPLFDASFSTAIGGYPKGSVLGSTSAGSLWLSKTDDNTNNPDVNTTGWVGVATSKNIQNGDWVYAVDSGASNAIVVTLSPVPAALVAGMGLRVKMANTNGGATTIAVNGLTAVPVVDRYGSALNHGALVSGQVVFLIYDGSSFQVVNDISPVLDTSTTFYVNNSTGNDSNNGLTTLTAWATIVHAVSAIAKYDLRGNVATVQLANTGIAYASPGTFSAPSSGQLIIQGDTASQSSYSISGSQSGSVFGVVSGNVVLKGLTMINTGTTGSLVVVSTGKVSLDHVTLTTTTPTAFPNALLMAGSGGTAAVGDGCIFSGSASAMWLAQTGGQIIYGSPMTVSGSPTFSTATAVCYAQGVIQAINNLGTWTGSATGKRYTAYLNGVIYTGGAGANFFPGTIAGDTSTGGQYA